VFKRYEYIVKLEPDKYVAEFTDEGETSIGKSNEEIRAEIYK